MIKVSLPPCRVGDVGADEPTRASGVERALDPAAEAGSGFRRGLPDGLQNAKHGFRVDRVNRRVPYRRAVRFERLAPLRGVHVAAPFAFLRGNQLVRAFPECRLFWRVFRGPLRPLRLDWIDAFRNKAPGVMRLLAGFLQVDDERRT